MTTESDITPSAADRHHPMLKLALELGPLMIFFFANLRAEWLAGKFPALAELGGPLFIAPALFMTATIASLAAVLAVGVTALLGYVFNTAFELDAEGWRKLTIRWGIFFLFCAVLNEVVWRGFNWYYQPDMKAADNAWVVFKVWGNIPITLIFTMSQMPLILKHSLNPETDGKK